MDGVRHQYLCRGAPRGTGWSLIDRKSTRLNSSHGYISYAVFCLKKKKIFFFFFNDTATTEIYTLSLHDSLPISRWMVFDTNIYVAALREGLGGPSFGRLEEAAPRTFLASVVSAELRAGAVDDVGRRTIIELVKRFERLGRVVVPTAGSWNDAGDVLAKIARRQPGFRTKAH